MSEDVETAERDEEAGTTFVFPPSGGYPSLDFPRPNTEEEFQAHAKA